MMCVCEHEKQEVDTNLWSVNPLTWGLRKVKDA